MVTAPATLLMGRRYRHGRYAHRADLGTGRKADRVIRHRRLSYSKSALAVRAGQGDPGSAQKDSGPAPGRPASFGGVASARGLARMYAAAITPLEGAVPLLKPDTAAAFAQIHSIGYDLVTRDHRAFAAGFHVTSEYHPVQRRFADLAAQALYGVLAQLEALHLELIEVRRLPPAGGAGSGWVGDHRAAADGSGAAGGAVVAGD